MIKKNLCGLIPDEIFSLVKTEGYTYNHAIDVAKSIYRRRITEMSRVKNIPNTLLRYLDLVTETGFYKPVSYEISADRTVKYLFISPEGKKFETVVIPDKKRTTVCVSAQSGCRMGCPFCVTGKYGYYGDLSAGDIVNQVISIPDSGNITNVVFMGMGEPMDNLENVLKACDILISEWGLALGARNITVSSVGITTGIKEFLNRSACNLTVSLYSPFSEERLSVIPAEKSYPVYDIIEMMKNFPVHKKRRFSIAYVMMKGINDTGRHLEGLEDLLTGSGIRVNLIPYHHFDNEGIRSSSKERMQSFKHDLVTSGISASIRKSRGADISAACGLLASGLK